VRVRDWAAAAGLCLAGFAIYANSLHNEFAFDDYDAIVENSHIRQLWPLTRSLTGEPGSGTSGRPVVAFSFALNHAIGGLDPLGYHLFNILVHVLAGLVLWALLCRTLQLREMPEAIVRSATGLALAIALVWLVHPLHTATLDHVVQRSDAMVALFYLFTLYGTLRAAEAAPDRATGRSGPGTSENAGSGAWTWPTLAILSCWLGMATKEVMITCPLLVLLFDRAFIAGSFGAAWRARRGLYIGLASSWILLVWLVAHQSRGASVGMHLEDLSPLDYARTQIAVVAHYLRLAFWPRPLVLDYRWPTVRQLSAVVPQALLLGILLAAALWAVRRAPRWSCLGIGFFLILAPTSSFIPLGGAVAAEHRMYLPLVPVVCAVLVAVALWLDRLPSRWRAILAWGSAGIVACSLATLTVQRNRDFRTEVTILTDTVTKSPTNARAHNNLGVALARQGQIDTAIEHYETAIRLHPRYVDPRNNLGILLVRQRRFDPAREQLSRALEIDPRNGMAEYNLAQLFLAQGQTDSALIHLQVAAGRMPGFAEVQNHLGTTYLQRGEYEQALEHFRQVLRLDPQHAAALNNTAWILATCPVDQVRDGRAALAYAARALQASPVVTADILDTQGAALAEAGQFDAAVAAAQRAVQLAADAGNTALRERIAARIDLYRRGAPFRMSAAR
jgi:tetratricopeptide (TPR) repeat protein